MYLSQTPEFMQILYNKMISLSADQTDILTSYDYMLKRMQLDDLYTHSKTLGLGYIPEYNGCDKLQPEICFVLETNSDTEHRLLSCITDTLGIENIYITSLSKAATLYSDSIYIQLQLLQTELSILNPYRTVIMSSIVASSMLAHIPKYMRYNDGYRILWITDTLSDELDKRYVNMVYQDIVSCRMGDNL